MLEKFDLSSKNLYNLIKFVVNNNCNYSMLWHSIFGLTLFFSVFIALIPNLLWLVAWCIGLIFGYHLPYAPFGWATAVLVCIVWITFTCGHYFGRFRSKVTEVEYSSSELPKAFDGYRIVHISDLHADSFDRPGHLEKLFQQIDDQHPDIVLFTGDMSSSTLERVREHESELLSLHSKDGVMSVLGNHDFFIYDHRFHTDGERSAEADRLTEYERETLGWKVLRNESFLIHRGTDSIAIAGVDNINGNQGFQTIQKGDLKSAVKGLDGIFTVLMTHDPSHWRAEVLPDSHVQITLSGHTHAAQVRLLGWSLANLMFDECDGRYDHEGRMLYVNAGLGGVVPFRIGCPSEITVITLRAARN